MAVKSIINELCGRCGERQATQRADGSIAVLHRCSKPTPGPPTPPKLFQPSEAIFVPAAKRKSRITPAQARMVLAIIASIVAFCIWRW